MKEEQFNLGPLACNKWKAIKCIIVSISWKMKHLGWAKYFQVPENEKLNILRHQFLFFPYLFPTTQAQHKTTLSQRKASQSPTVWFLRKGKAKQKKNSGKLTFLFPFLGFPALKNWKWNPKFISFFPKFSQQPNRPKHLGQSMKYAECNK